MESIPARAFLSRVFDKRVADSLKRVELICKALDIETICVDRASSSVPAEVAKEEIKKSDFLIAICTRTDKLDGSDKYVTSAAVREEIAFAKALDKKVICFLEQGISADGFVGNMFTYSKLENAEALTADDLFQIVQGIHRTKCAAITRSEEIQHATGVGNFFVSSYAMQIALMDTPSGLLWDYVIERKYSFEAEHDFPLTHAAFAPQNAGPQSGAPKWKLEFEKNGKAIQPTLSETKSIGAVEIKSTFDPPLNKGDVLFVRERYRYPFLTPIHSGQGIRQAIKVGGTMLDAYDGVAIINRIQQIRLTFVFPRGYAPRDIQPVVGTFSFNLDHSNDDEVARLTEAKCFTVEQFDDTVKAHLVVERPLYQYFYGAGWNLPDPGELKSAIAPEDTGWD